MFIEPCCAHRQLPPLFRDATNPDSGIFTSGIVSFYTNGDVNIPTFLDATASVLSDSPFTILVSTPVITSQLLSHLNTYHRRGWADGFLLMDAPSDDPSDDLSQDTVQSSTTSSISIPSEIASISRYVSDISSTSSPVLAMIGRKRVLVCTGLLPATSPTGIVTHHSAYLGDHNLITKRYLDHVLSRFRIKLHGQSITTPHPRLDDIIAGHIFD